MSEVACTVHEWGDRGTPGNYWRECWLCGAIEDVDNRPSADDLLGIAPDWTGGLTTDEFIARQRRRGNADPA